MATQKLKKSLPKRCTNERLKARRTASYARGVEAKARRRSAQERRERANHQNLGPTPWQRVKEEARKNYVPPVKQGKKALIIDRNTSHEQIRRAFFDNFLGAHGITIGYLDEVDRRWAALGGKLRGGAL